MEKATQLKSYKDLRTWQKAITLVDDVYALVKAFPAKEQVALSNQLTRAAVLVPANIAEGWGRESRKSFVQFLKIARGSLYETDTLLTVAAHQQYVTEVQFATVSKQVEEVGKMLNSLIISIEKKNGDS